MEKLEINGLQIEVAESDYKVLFNKKFTWKQVQEILSKVGDEWRIPNNLELEQLFKKLHQKGLGEFKGHTYWSSENTIDGGSKYLFFLDYAHGDENRLFGFHNNVDGEDVAYSLRLVRNT